MVRPRTEAKTALDEPSDPKEDGKSCGHDQKDAPPLCLQFEALLARAAADDLAAIDEQIADYRAAVARLEQIRSLIASRLGLTPPKRTWSRRPKAAADGTPGRKAAAEEPSAGNGPAIAGSAGLLRSQRLSVVRLLETKGELGMMKIGDELDIPENAMPGVLACDWFERSPNSRTGGYRATAAGKKAAGLPV